MLAPEGATYQIVAPAGRQVVATHPMFSNPYVDFSARRRAHAEMVAALEAGDEARFVSLASRQGVTHVIALNEPRCAGHRPALRLMARFERACAYQVQR